MFLLQKVIHAAYFFCKSLFTLYSFFSKPLFTRHTSFAKGYSREQNNSSLLLRSRFTVHERNFGATQPMQMNLAQHPLRIILLEVGFMFSHCANKILKTYLLHQIHIQWFCSNFYSCSCCHSRN